MLIKGAVGNVEAKWDQVTEATEVAILCHPHPQFGGSMDDAVLQLTATTLNLLGFDCLRFNFRGVGNSEGTYDNGVGEIEDLLAVAGWLAGEKPTPKPWLVGYSFGAHVVWQSLDNMDEDQVAGVILIAPPVGRMSFSQLNDLSCPVYAVAGDGDDFVDEQAFRKWSGINTQVVPGADHFFSGSYDGLASALKSFLG